MTIFYAAFVKQSIDILIERKRTPTKEFVNAIINERHDCLKGIICRNCANDEPNDRINEQ